MRIARKFTTAGQSPFKGVSFTTIDIDRPHANPAERCCVTDFEVPAHWEEQACETLITLYARHDGIPVATRRIEEKGVPHWLQQKEADDVALGALAPEDRSTGEQSILQMLSRMVGAWTYAGWKQDYFDTEEDARAFYDEWCYMLIHQMASPASPQWMHGGLHWAYGLRGSPQGHWFADAQSGDIVESPDSFSHPQLHSCFIQGVGDDLVSEGGIMDLLTRETRAFKYGATTGSNVSHIRASGERLSNGEVSPGLLNFLSVGDRNAGAIHARSADKRTSKLVVVDIDHPDVPAFIRWKMEEEIKAAALLCGMQHIVKHVQRVLQVVEQAQEDCTDPCDVTLNPKLAHVVRQARRSSVPESVITHTLQRANQGFMEVELPAIGLVGTRSVTRDVSAHQVKLAVRMQPEFMEAAAREDLWHTTGRADKSLSHMLCATSLLDSITEAVWSSGDPTIQFADNIDALHTCPKSGAIRASNPNNEAFFLDDTATAIATLNALAFIKDSTPDYELLLHAVRLLSVQLDITVDQAQFPSQQMATKTLAHRPIGVSLCNLSGYLMVQGIAYDSDLGRNTIAALNGFVTGAAYHISVEIAKELNPFIAYTTNKHAMQNTLRKQAASVLDNTLADPLLLQMAEREWSLALVHGEQHGYRNAQTTLLAEMPVVMQLLNKATPAAEPTRTLQCTIHRTQGVRICHDLIIRGLQSLSYGATQICDIQAHICGTGSLKDAPHISHQALSAKGFKDEQLALIEEALPTAKHISDVFDPWVLGEHFCREQLGISDTAIFDADFDMLEYLRFSTEEIHLANRYACGAASVHNAPHMRKEDYAVFACLLNETNSDTAVSPSAHIAMLGAITPCVSGGIFHHVTLENASSIAQVRALLLSAHTTGLKAIHMHRLGCGLHMQSGFSAAQEEVLEEATPRLVSLRKLHGPYRPSLEQIKEAKA